VSRSGWAVHDDTLTPRFQAQDPKPGELRWFDLTNGSSDAAVGTAPQLRVGQDLYFLGHGHAYVQALQDWSMVSGPIALPPQSAFGVWWSRYYPYSDQSFIKEVMIPYTQNDLPLNHAVLDMDWYSRFHSSSNGVDWTELSVR
jgi:alpha-glucosidase (family GH31 glycosyl hydrolase)